MEKNGILRYIRGRESFGYGYGKEDAKQVIESLARDKNGNITETIKIITHSMGGTFGKGLVKALKEYIKKNHLDQQAKITLVADFDPYQAGDLTADPDIKTIGTLQAWDGLQMKEKRVMLKLPKVEPLVPTTQYLHF